MPPADKKVAERIPIASDHAGFEMKEKLVNALRAKGFDVDDKGTRSAEPSDYPEFARRVACAIRHQRRTQHRMPVLRPRPIRLPARRNR